MSEIHVCWEWPLQSRPSELWPLISNTDRFNADSGVPAIEQLEQSQFRRRLKLSRLGVSVEWEEEPFEWLRPERFGVVRRYRTGPLLEMRVLAELLEHPSRLRYQVWAAARSALAGVLVRLQLLESRYRFNRTIRAYDAIAAQRDLSARPAETVRLSPDGSNRLERARRALLNQGIDEALVSRLCGMVEHSPDENVHRVRPYELADAWAVDRRTVLELFLRAAHTGLFELQWVLLCPLCRGAKQRAGELGDVDSHVRCEACNIDFQADFDRSVELTFRPGSDIREVNLSTYCVGGPQNTPHIIMQQIVEPGDRRNIRVPLEPGMYRIRRWGQTRGRMLRAVAGFHSGPIVLNGEPGPETMTSTDAEFTLENESNDTRLLALERFAWSDQAATAADVTALQLFRSLFPGEALRPAMPFSVDRLTVMFTDLVGSTRLYQALGDEAAFNKVLQQQQVLTEAVEAEGGAVVKTLGDRSMAVFRQPVAAFKSAARVQDALASPLDPLLLKVGIHSGPSIAVTLNERLDYYGTTVNIAARLAGISQGDDLVATGSVLGDPEVRSWLSRGGLSQQHLANSIENLDGGSMEIFRVWRTVRG